MDEQLKIRVWHVLMVAIINTLMLASCSYHEATPWSEQETMAAASPNSSVMQSPPIVSNQHVTLSHLNMNNEGSRILVKPQSIVQVLVQYSYHCPNCVADLNNQIIVGLANRSAQACIYNGRSSGQGYAEFTLKAPAKPGKYDVRFRGLQAADCAQALKAGWQANNSPTNEATIGTIFVSKKMKKKDEQS
jgi:hypothetical protein